MNHIGIAIVFFTLMVVLSSGCSCGTGLLSEKDEDGRASSIAPPDVDSPRPFETIRARRIEIVDENNKVVGVIDSLAGAGTLLFTNQENSASLSMGFSEGAFGFEISGHHANGSVRLGGPRKNGDGAYVGVTGRNSNSAVMMAGPISDASFESVGGLMIHNAEGQAVAWILANDAKAGEIRLEDGQGSPPRVIGPK